ncbi:GlsB/YeaQ/YmgE family stress response membrane protein [Mycoplasmatota bacterium]|nr:GlsB/YeaQ/YmgE family stress response membrane protein [Mycoplasmatota bacterium]
MGFIIWIIFGLIVGWIANSIMGVGRRGFFKNLIIGLIGALVGGWLGDWLFKMGTIGAFTLSGFIFSVFGAIIFIWIIRLLKV